MIRAWLLAMAFAAACGAEAPPSSDPVESTATAGGYELTFALPRSVWRADEAIHGQATLKLVGEGATTISGSGTNVFSFQFSGAGLSVNPVSPSICARHPIDVDTPLRRT